MLSLVGLNFNLKGPTTRMLEIVIKRQIGFNNNLNTNHILLCIRLICAFTMCISTGFDPVRD